MEGKFWTSKWAAIIIFGGVLILWVSVPYVTGWFAPKFTARGPFGDQFGSVTALFSGLAFAGLILTLFMQNKELNLTRESVKAQTEELKLSSDALKAQVEEMGHQRNEMEAMKEAQQAQVDYMARQAFESTFFQILKLWNERTDKLSEHRGAKGRGCFNVWSQKFPPHKYVAINGGEPFGEKSRVIINNSDGEFDNNINRFFENNADQLRTYFLLLYNCLFFIERAKLSPKEKQYYCNIVRANLTPNEIAINLYNAISKNDLGLGFLAWKYNLFLHFKKELMERHTIAWQEFEDKFN